MKIRSLAIAPMIVLTTLPALAQTSEEAVPKTDESTAPEEEVPSAPTGETESPEKSAGAIESNVEESPKEKAEPSAEDGTEEKPPAEDSVDEVEKPAEQQPEKQLTDDDFASTEISEREANESEEAAIAAESPAHEAPERTPTSGFDNGFFVQSKDGKYKMTLGSLFQGRFTRTSQAPEDGAAEYGYRFSLPRARVALSGHFYSKDLTYRVEFDFDDGDAGLKDYYFDYRLHEWAHVRVGQDRLPFLRQQITPGANQQFVDRAFNEGEFGRVRDIGVMIHNDYRNVAGFEYAVGFYNGTGDEPRYSGGTGAVDSDDAVQVSGGSFSNVPAKMEPAAALRLGYNNGVKGYSESELEEEIFGVAVGAAGFADFNFDGTNDSVLRATVDAMIKIQRWSLTGAATISSIQADHRFKKRRLEKAGGFLQGGYVINSLLEPAVRWSTVTTQGTTDDEDVVLNSYQAGVNLFFHGHRVKWSNDFGLLLQEQGNATTTGTEFRSQAQLSF